MEKMENPSLNILPDEILVSVFGFLSLKDHLRLEIVSKRWQMLLKHCWPNIKHLKIESVFEAEDKFGTRGNWTISPQKARTLFNRCSPYVQSLSFEKWHNYWCSVHASQCHYDAVSPYKACSDADADVLEERNEILQEMVNIEFLQLKKVSFDGVNLPETSFQLIGRLNNLESLNIGNCISGAAEIMRNPAKRITRENDFKEMLQSHQMLKNLVIGDQWGALGGGTFLKYASYSVESIKMRSSMYPLEVGLLHLFTLGYRPALKELRLNCCKTADEDVVAILLSGAPNLEIFELSYISLSVFNCEALAKFQNLQEIHTNLVGESQDFDFENRGWPTRFLEQVPHSEFQLSLRALRLDCKEMRHEDGEKLIKNLACFTTLKELHLSDVECCLNEKILETLFSSCKEIEVLSLVDCSIVDNAGLAVIGRLCPDLVNVNLCDSKPFSVEGVQALVDGVFGTGKRNPKKSLSIKLPRRWEDSPFVETIAQTYRSKLEINFFL